jgi:hypothetical protein
MTLIAGSGEEVTHQFLLTVEGLQVAALPQPQFDCPRSASADNSRDYHSA